MPLSNFLGRHGRLFCLFAVSEPTVTYTPSTFSDGSAVLLTCNAEITATTFEWTKDGDGLDGETAASYGITSFGSANEGEYSCTAITADQSKSPPATSVTLEGMKKIITFHEVAFQHSC